MVSYALVGTLLGLSPSAQLCGGVLGDLDPSFGVSGQVEVSQIGAGAVELQSDGKILIADWLDAEMCGHVRLLPDGSLDPEFGQGGFVITNLADHFLEVSDMQVQEDGKIVTVGYAPLMSPGTGGVACVMRHHADGTLDASFGAGGLVLTDFSGVPGDFSVLDAVDLQPDGKIVAAGYFSVTGQIFVARYEANGSLDTSFSGNGWTAMGGEACDDVIVLDDGKILVAARIGGQFAVRRFLPDGSNDIGFGLDGAASATFPHSAGAHAIHAYDDGRVLAIGWGGGNQLSARFLADGSLDPSFGQGGVSSVPPTDDLSELRGITLHVFDDGTFVVGGTVLDFIAPFTAGPSVSRYLPDGTLDGGFGMDGHWVGHIGFPSWGRIAVQDDGKIVVASNSGPVFRLLNPPGFGDLHEDPSFGTGGTVTSSNGVYLDADVQSDGRLILTMGEGTGFGLERRLGDGTIDPSFGTGGTTVTSIGIFPTPAQSEILPNGKIATVGTTVDPQSFENVGAVTVHLSDGTPDPSFSGDGAAFMPILSAGLSTVAGQPDGKILAGGHYQSFGQYIALMARFQPDGFLDTGFGQSGFLGINLGADVFQSWAELRVLPDGKILAAGYAGQAFVLARVGSDGVEDASFGVGGKVLVPFDKDVVLESMHLYDDGRVLIVGTQLPSGEDPAEMTLVRFLPDGSLDGAFGVDGFTTLGDGQFSTGIDVEVTSDGRIYAIGNRSPALTGPENNVILARFDCSGVLDPTHGAGGVLTLPGEFSFELELLTDGRLVRVGQGVVDSVPAGQVMRLVPGPVWEDLGQGLAGTNGTPVLTGFGGHEPGSSYSVRIAGALETSFSWLLIGTIRIDLPIAGGTLVPSPDLVLPPVLTGAQGSTQLLAGPWDPSLSGIELYFQAWTFDPVAPQQFSATNGLLTRVP